MFCHKTLGRVFVSYEKVATKTYPKGGMASAKEPVFTL
jgi:hypothetical protein